MFRNTLQILLSYLHAFCKEYAVCFGNVCMMDIVAYLMFSKFLAGISKCHQMPYNRAVKRMIKHKYVLLLLLFLSRYAPVPNTSGITLDGNQGLYISSDQHIVLMTRLLGYPSKTTKSRHQHPITFRWHAKLLHNKYHYCNSDEGDKLFPTFVLFFETLIQRKVIFQSITFLLS